MSSNTPHVKDEQTERICWLVKEYLESGHTFDSRQISEEDLRTILSYNSLKRNIAYLFLLVLAIILLVGGCFAMKITLYDMKSGKECLVDNFLREMMFEKIVFTKKNDCGLCRNVRKIAKRRNLSPGEFERKYAYSMRPVVVTDAAKNWSAIRKFSYPFLKRLFRGSSLEAVAERCQFFPYKSNFESLGDVFQMSRARAEQLEGTEPWYVGWSNCHLGAAELLRAHYGRPYFLPSLSEASKTDWIFMGSPGYGAPIHVDNVKMPSWQAQLSGRKRWTLQPPYECRLQCPNNLTVTVNRGDIIVLDTNYWYHGTEIIGDELSITIGTEYD